MLSRVKWSDRQTFLFKTQPSCISLAMSNVVIIIINRLPLGDIYISPLADEYESILAWSLGRSLQ
jgi:hypothetical protein